MKVSGGLNIHGDGCLVSQMGEVTRREALFAAPMGGVLNDSNGQVNFAGPVIGRRCNRVETGGNLVEEAGNFRGLKVDSRCIVQDVDDIPVKNVLLQFFFVGTDCLQFIPGRASGFFSNRFDEFFSDSVEDGRGCKGFVQGSIVMQAQFLGEFTNQGFGIPREDAEGVSTLVGRAGGA